MAAIKLEAPPLKNGKGRPDWAAVLHVSCRLTEQAAGRSPSLTPFFADRKSKLYRDLLNQLAFAETALLAALGL